MGCHQAGVQGRRRARSCSHHGRPSGPLDADAFGVRRECCEIFDMTAEDDMTAGDDASWLGTGDDDGIDCGATAGATAKFARSAGERHWLNRPGSRGDCCAGSATSEAASVVSRCSRDPLGPGTPEVSGQALRSSLVSSCSGQRWPPPRGHPSRPDAPGNPPFVFSSSSACLCRGCPFSQGRADRWCARWHRLPGGRRRGSPPGGIPATTPRASLCRSRRDEAARPGRRSAPAVSPNVTRRHRLT